MKTFSASLIVDPYLPTPILWFSGWHGQADRRELLARHARAGRMMLWRNGGINHCQKCQLYEQSRLTPRTG
jgi:hypothetical protein